MKKKTKIIIAVFTSIVVILGGLGVNYLISVDRYQKTVSNMTYENIDPSKIPNGVYVGECNVDFIYAKVEVYVEDGTITNIILLEHKNDRGHAAEGIEKEIVTQQKINVDEVSGATNSSKVIKKAVDNALLSSLE